MHLMDYLAQPRPDMDTQRYDPTKRKAPHPNNGISRLDLECDITDANCSSASTFAEISSTSTPPPSLSDVGFNSKDVQTDPHNRPTLEELIDTRLRAMKRLDQLEDILTKELEDFCPVRLHDLEDQRYDPTVKRRAPARHEPKPEASDDDSESLVEIDLSEETPAALSHHEAEGPRMSIVGASPKDKLWIYLSRRKFA